MYKHTKNKLKKKTRINLAISFNYSLTEGNVNAISGYSGPI